MSHVGLARATFAAPSGDSDVATEYKLLSNAAVVRTESLDRHGRWIPDSTIYPLKDAPPAKAETAFVAFKGYVPPVKAKDAKVRLLHESEVAKGAKVMSPRVSSPDMTEASNNLRGSVQGSHTAFRDAVADSLELASPVPISNDQGTDHPQNLLDDEEPFDCQQPPLAALLSPTLHNANAMVRSVQPLVNPETEVVRNQGPPMAGSCILDWQDEIKSQFTMPDQCQGELLISREDEIQPQSAIPNDYEGDLICLNEPDEGALSGSGPAGSEIQSTVMELHEVKDRLARLEQFKSSDDDLICLDYDEPPAQKLPQEASILDTCDHDPIYENNPLEAQEQILTSRASDGSLRFGLMKEEPKVLFRTMNQRGGRAINPPGKAAPSPKGNSSRAPKGTAKRSQSIQSSSRRNASTPAEPKHNPEVSLGDDPAAAY